MWVTGTVFIIWQRSGPHLHGRSKMIIASNCWDIYTVSNFPPCYATEIQTFFSSCYC